ncbi:MAG TPA: transglutaminase-like domain-containing protein [Polyangiales bacterium]|nr:transglutaminase-like domain-containing protein [Polyangiales bacterium]
METSLRGRLAGLTVAGLLLAVPVRAEPSLHEYVPNVDPREVSPLGAAEPGGGSGASAAAGADTTESAPAYQATAGEGTPGEPPGRRAPSFRPDRLTELASGLDYYEVFTPSIAPFKRVTSLGQIELDVDGKTPVLVARDTQHTLVKIEGEDSRPPDARPRDRFRGDVRLDFSDGLVVPLPSVSPESRILSLTATPSLPLRIERDADDNYAVRLLGPAPSSPVHVEFVTDAPRSYFGAEISQAKVDVFASELPPLERSIHSRGLSIAKRLGLSRKSELGTALETLTRYFRAFEESKAPPENTGDLYLDLARSQKGICRHRAYAFVVTAQSLGIVARFVQNEAHSWVEVKLPRSGFLRIDLGGASEGLTAHSANDAPSYVPAQPDSLPQPESYRRSYARAAARARGTAPGADSVAGRWLNANQLRAPDPAAAARGPADSSAQGSVAAAQASQAPPQPAARESRNPKRPLSLSLEQQAFTALRGTELQLAGRVRNEAAEGVSGLRVEIWIASPRRDERMLLGVCVSEGNGEFHASLGVPSDLQVGDYRLVVLTPGDARYAAAVAQ